MKAGHVMIEPWAVDLVWSEDRRPCHVCGALVHTCMPTGAVTCVVCAGLAPEGAISYRGFATVAGSEVGDDYFLAVAEEGKPDEPPYLAEWRALIRVTANLRKQRWFLHRWLQVPFVPTRVLRLQPLPEWLQTLWPHRRALETGLLVLTATDHPPWRLSVAMAKLPAPEAMDALVGLYPSLGRDVLIELKVLDGDMSEDRLVDVLYGGRDERAIVPLEIRPPRYEAEALAADEVDALQRAIRSGRDVVRVLVELAVGRRASDIHVEPCGDITRVRMRVGGVLQTVARLNADDWEPIALAIKSVANIRAERAVRERKGAFTWRGRDGQTTDCRVSIIPVSVPGIRGEVGEAVVVRLLDKSIIERRPQDIGLMGRAYALIETFVQAGARGHWGMVVLSGPTGSGKTTTLHMALRQLNLDPVNVCAIEDPVEYHIAGIKQASVSPSFSFADAIRAFLRQDPDIMLVGEVRDRETARAAVEAALTGHMVLTTVHANTAFQVIRRLVDLLMEPNETRTSVLRTVLLTLRLISTQRMMRRPCPDCAQRITLPETTRALGYSVGYVGEGCATCRSTGFGDRIPVFEVAGLDDRVQEEAMRIPLDVLELEVRQLCEMQGLYVSMLEDALWKTSRKLLDARCLETLGRPVELNRTETSERRGER